MSRTPKDGPSRKGDAPAGLDGEVVGLVALGVQRALAADREKIRNERRARRAPSVTGPRWQRGCLLVAAGPDLPGDFGIGLEPPGGHSSTAVHRRTLFDVWFPERNAIRTIRRSLMHLADPDEGRRIAERASASRDAAFALAAQAGDILVPIRPVQCEFQTPATTRILHLGPDDRLVHHPMPHADTSMTRRRNGWRRSDEPDDAEHVEWPPSELLGAVAWKKAVPEVLWCWSQRHRLRVPVDASALRRMEWAPGDPMDRVVLPDGWADALLDIVHRSIHGQQSGRGVNILFHGPPGVGKTYTAHCLAERLCRPVIVMDGRDLGGDVAGFEANIRSILLRAELWRGVIVCDEADMVLAHRDGLDYAGYTVAMLRLLDDHGGVLILTTNRAFVIDDAFRSRLHARLEFPALVADTRHAVWRLVLGRAALPEDWADELSDLRMDGREIGHALDNALSAALRAGRAPDLPLIRRHATRLAEESRRSADFDAMGPSQKGKP